MAPPRWEAAEMDECAICVHAAKRFCRIAYQMVAGGQVFKHPSCQGRDAILRKLSAFHADHETTPVQVMTDLQAAVDHLPQSEHTPEAKSLFGEVERDIVNYNRRLHKLAKVHLFPFYPEHPAASSSGLSTPTTAPSGPTAPLRNPSCAIFARS